ncbi:L-glutamate gamma-semialdehyde dehydrogenase [Ramlibacter sp. MAHUQ-53]|uniref:L-glutamate gamma-semialdehyde dehydrogenase n=1 Tax=unclassified Ramlibacter TaxID=2617605 RepID=UPI003629F224
MTPAATGPTARLPDPYRPEAQVLADRLARLEGALDWSAVMREATPWVQAVRSHPPPFWAMESLLREYPISSAEGLALMRLAEALLRVPDIETAIALAADQLGQADFAAAGDSTLARLSGAVIALSRRLLPADGEPDGLWERLGARTLVAAALRAVQLLGHQFVMAQDIHQALASASRHGGGLHSFDMLGEGARTAADARRYADAYAQALQAIAARAEPARGPGGNDGLSIKLSALHPRYEDAQRDRVLAELVPRAWALCERAAAANLNLTLDAEEVDRLELSLDVFEALALQVRAHCPQWSGLGLALQAYQTRALDLVEQVITLGRRLGLRFTCRLVKGAYWDAEVKRAQELGLPHYPVFTHRAHTDVSYLACARALLDAGDVVFPQFATHNAATLAAVARLAAGRPFELQRLHGMGEGVYREALKDGALRCRVYAPVGRHRDLLAYLVRRLLENGANSSFVHQLADPAVDLPALLASPMARARAFLAAPASLPGLPLPRDLLGERRNSEGVDLAVPAMREPLLAAHARLQVPLVAPADPGQVAEAVERARAAFPAWEAMPVAERAAILLRAADTLQQRLPPLAALLVKEARKTWGDAVAEVREAVDFLRYYALEAGRVMAPVALPGPTGESNALRLCGRGAWVCISPWNFPLAIFTGQVAAALATGNTVLAKPAEQTPAIAQEAVRVLHEAGVPAGALQLLHGPGETVGAALVARAGIAGVAFTGSTAVARAIQRALAAQDGPILPLVAETGGVNAMLVDSTALPEQVADAVVHSAFRSAGQRCSALRLLLLHEAIADEVVAMVAGAAAELRTGEPSQVATDIGPVIDDAAFAGLQAHIARLRATGRLLYAPPPLPGQPPGLVGPHLFEVDDIGQVTEEVFGPVLQVARWRGDPLAVVDRVNALGWGLTLGIQTRIEGRARALAARARIGNVYVNRAMTGAVVGVQPFGGEGLSGTGPKAGGPHYLPRFCVERTVSINTAAAGGNAALMARVD